MKTAQQVDAALARALADERQAIGMKQRELGEKVGLGQSAVSLWENNRKPITAGLLAHICHAMSVDPLAVYARALNGTGEA